MSHARLLLISLLLLLLVGGVVIGTIVVMRRPLPTPPSVSPSPQVSPDLAQGIQPVEPCFSTTHYEQLEAALANPDDVCIMTLTGAGLTSLPPEIGQLRKIIVLNIGETGLTTLPPEIGQLRNLQFLLLSNNQLASIPDEIGQLQHLVQLDLTNNPLSDETKAKVKQLLSTTEIHF